MGRKLDPTNKVKRGPGKKAKKQRGAEVELAKFITDGKKLLFCFSSKTFSERMCMIETYLIAVLSPGLLYIRFFLFFLSL